MRIAILLVLVLAGSAAARDASDKTLESLWDALSSDDAARSSLAALKLAAKGKDAVAFLEKKLKPVKVDAKQVAKWIKQLDEDNFEDREAAQAELLYLGKFIKPALEKALNGTPSVEVSKRLQVLLQRIQDEEPIKKADPGIPAGGGVSISTVNGKMTIRIGGKVIDLNPRVIVKPGPLPVWQRAARATAVLEHLNTPEAKALLKKMADGEADALPTKAAKEALKRLEK
jgi:hypothetical protein